MFNLKFFTDKDLLDLSGDREVTTYKDCNLRYNHFQPIQQGIFDSAFFGSIQEGACNCGKETEEGRLCNKCNTVVYSEESKELLVGRIKLPIYFLPKLKMKGFFEFIKSRFEINIKPTSFHPKLNDILHFNFDYDETSGTLYITNKYDTYLTGLDRLHHLVKKHFPDYLNELENFIHKYIPVTPIVSRAPSFYDTGKGRKLAIPKVNSVYKSIIYLSQFYEAGLTKFNLSPEDQAYFGSVLRLYLADAVMELTSLTKTSKETFTRQLMSSGSRTSGRGVITPDTTHKLNEVVLPLHMATLIFHKEYTAYLINDLKINDKKLLMQKIKNPSLEHIKEVVIGRKVLLQRAPTLHKYNVMAFQVVDIEESYSIKLPLEICSAFGADFDGDAMVVHKIPSELEEYIWSRSNPEKLLYYEKTSEVIASLTPEFKSGFLTAANGISEDEPIKYASLEEADEGYNEGELYSDNLIEIGLTKDTYGKLKLKDVLGFDYTELTGPKVNPNHINDIISKLYSISDAPLDSFKELQEFVLKVASIECEVLGLGIIKSNIDTTVNTKLKDKVEHYSKLSDVKKYALLKLKYDEYINSTDHAEVKNLIENSGKLKLDEIKKLFYNQIAYDPRAGAMTFDSNIFTGLSDFDHKKLSYIIRKLLEIKVSFTPISGYITRQLVFLANNIRFSFESDETNKGLIIPSNKDLIGRTKLDGTLVTESDIESSEYIKVKSVVSKSENYDTYTKDLMRNSLYELSSYEVGDFIGIAFITGLSEQLTQKALSIKHGGTIANLKKDGIKAAEDDVYVESLEDSVLVLSNGNRYLVSDKFNLLQDIGVKHKKDDLIGISTLLESPTIEVEAISKIIKAMGTFRVRVNTPKSEINFSYSHSLSEGEFKIVDSTTFKIGPDVYSIEGHTSNTNFLIAEGTHVKRFDRISDSYFSFEVYAAHSLSIEDQFILFYIQMKELYNINSELIEFLFFILINPNTSKTGELKVESVSSKLLNLSESSDLISLTFGYSKKHLATIFKNMAVKEMSDTPHKDPPNNLLLNLLLNKKVEHENS